MNSLKRINRILFITLVVFSIAVFGNYSKTASKYVIDKNDNIINKTNFKILTRDVSVSSKFVDEKAIFDFNFYRTAAKDDKNVKSDTIDINFEDASLNKCSIKADGITGFISNSGKNSYTITSKGVRFIYGDVTSNTTADKSIKVTYECEIDDSILTSDEHVQTNFIAVEKIKLKDNTEEEAFELFRKTAKSSDKYIKPDPEDPVYLDNYKKLKFIDKTLDRTLLNEWIDKYILEYYSSETQDASLPSFSEVLASYLGFKETSWNPNSIKGFSYDSTTKTYAFDDNIINYANTSISTSKPKRLYFKNPAGRDFTKVEIDNLFKEYYDKYYSSSPSTTEDREIYDYIVASGGISSIILDGKNIIGVDYNTTVKFVRIDKELINLKLHPVNPDVILEGVTDVDPDISRIMQTISGSISDFVNMKLGINDFDENFILKNRFLQEYISDLKNNAEPNTYYYLPLSDKVLSMRFYKDGTDYTMHLDALSNFDIVKDAEKHILVSLDKMYKLTTDTDDYAQLRSDFTNYIKGLDVIYGTTFETDGAINTLNNVINIVINAISSGKTSGKVSGKEFIENTKNASIVIKYTMETNIEYGMFAIEFVPPVNETKTANSATKVPANSSTSTKTTTTTVSNQLTLATTVRTTTKSYREVEVSVKDEKVCSN